MLAKVEPQSVRHIELTAAIPLLVVSNRGVAVLPDWVVNKVRYNSDCVSRPLTENGPTRGLFAATGWKDTIKLLTVLLLELARTEPVKMHRSWALAI